VVCYRPVGHVAEERGLEGGASGVGGGPLAARGDGSIFGSGSSGGDSAVVERRQHAALSAPQQVQRRGVDLAASACLLMRCSGRHRCRDREHLAAEGEGGGGRRGAERRRESKLK